jgi:hypothetical protein
MIHRQFLAHEQLRQIFLGIPGVEGVASKNLWPPAPTISPRKFFIVSQTDPRLLPKPECDEDRYCESAKRKCTWAREGRSEL